MNYADHCIDFAVALLAFFLGRWSRKPSAQTRAPTFQVHEPTCTGYNAYILTQDGKTTEHYNHKVDCKALRSDFCNDGRCSYHCGQMCKCKVEEETDSSEQEEGEET